MKTEGLTVEQAAARLKMTTERIRGAIRTGALPMRSGERLTTSIVTISLVHYMNANSVPVPGEAAWRRGPAITRAKAAKALNVDKEIVDELVNAGKLRRHSTAFEFIDEDDLNEFFFNLPVDCKEAAKLLGTSVAGLKLAVLEGRLRPTSPIGNKFTRSELERHKADTNQVVSLPKPYVWIIHFRDRTVECDWGHDWASFEPRPVSIPWAKHQITGKLDEIVSVEQAHFLIRTATPKSLWRIALRAPSFSSAGAAVEEAKKSVEEMRSERRVLIDDTRTQYPDADKLRQVESLKAEIDRTKADSVKIREEFIKSGAERFRAQLLDELENVLQRTPLAA